MVDAALKAEWIAEQMHEIADIATYIADGYFPKNDRSCKAFGKVCYKLQSCKSGAPHGVVIP